MPVLHVFLIRTMYNFTSPLAQYVLRGMGVPKLEMAHRKIRNENIVILYKAYQILGNLKRPVDSHCYFGLREVSVTKLYNTSDCNTVMLLGLTITDTELIQVASWA